MFGSPALHAPQVPCGWDSKCWRRIALHAPAPGHALILRSPACTAGEGILMRTKNSRLRGTAGPLALSAVLIGMGPLLGGTARSQPSFGDVGVHVSYVQVRDATDGNFLGGVHAELRPIQWLGFNAAVDFRSDAEYDIPTGARNSTSRPNSKLLVPPTTTRRPLAGTSGSAST
jgi:hypothetical protein